MTGDVSKVQRRLLRLLISKDAEQAFETERQRFKLNMIAAHPDRLESILQLFEEVDAFADELTEEEIEELGPLSGEQIEEALDVIKQFGAAIIKS